MRRCGFNSDSHFTVPGIASIQQRQRQSFVCAAGGGKRRRPAKDKDADSKQASPGPPPPPPTTAPPAAPIREPLRKQAFRQARVSEEQRRSEREAREAAAAEAARAHTVWADSKSLKQALEQGPARRQVPLFLIDGYNYLNKDKELVALGNIHRARNELHRRLLRYTMDGATEARVVYDAMGTGDVGVRTDVLSPFLSVAYACSCEADTLIIAEAERLRVQFMQNPSRARQVLVVSDDRRIQEACGPTGWVLGPSDSGSNLAYDEVTAVACSYLTESLQRFERTAGMRGDSSNGDGRARPSLQGDTAAWATRLLQQVQLPDGYRLTPVRGARIDSHPVQRQLLAAMEAEEEGHAGHPGKAAGMLSDDELEALLDDGLSPLSSLDEMLEDDISKRFGLDDLL